MKHLLTIAGSDSSGGAGIQADLKTFAAHGTFGMSVITAVTAQNTTGVTRIQNIDAEVVAAQIDAVFSDIHVDAVKVGMVSILVVDPVMVATSGAYLLEETARRTLLEKLLPLASVITPNMMEGEVLSGMTIRSKDDMEKAAHAILDACGAAVLLKGGHLAQTADDYLLEKDGRGTWLLGRHIDNSNTHGTGCSLSSALASELALGHTLPEAAQLAKDYVALGIEHGLPVGHGHGPIHHFVSLYEKAGIGK